MGFWDRRVLDQVMTVLRSANYDQYVSRLPSEYEDGQEMLRIRVHDTAFLDLITINARWAFAIADVRSDGSVSDVPERHHYSAELPVGAPAKRIAQRLREEVEPARQLVQATLEVLAAGKRIEAEEEAQRQALLVRVSGLSPTDASATAGDLFDPFGSDGHPFFQLLPSVDAADIDDSYWSDHPFVGDVARFAGAAFITQDMFRGRKVAAEIEIEWDGSPNIVVKVQGISDITIVPLAEGWHVTYWEEAKYVQRWMTVAPAPDWQTFAVTIAWIACLQIDPFAATDYQSEIAENLYALVKGLQWGMTGEVADFLELIRAGIAKQYGLYE